MERRLIEGVHLKPLVAHADERGYLMEMLRCDDPIFQKFGQAYVSLNYPGVIRAWHWHEKQTDYWVVVKGMVKAVLYDRRPDSPTHGMVNEFFLGRAQPRAVSDSAVGGARVQDHRDGAVAAHQFPHRAVQPCPARRVSPALQHARNSLRLGDSDGLEARARTPFTLAELVSRVRVPLPITGCPARPHRRAVCPP
jgi:hypothetical protein